MPRKKPTEEQLRRNAKLLADAKRTWGGTKKAAGKAAKGVGNVADITWDTLKGSAKEVTSGDFGLRIGRHTTKAAKAVGRGAGDIFKVAAEQAKKYLNDAVKAGAKASAKMDEAVPPNIVPGDIPTPKKKAIEDRFAEEGEWGIKRRINRKK